MSKKDSNALELFKLEKDDKNKLELIKEKCDKGSTEVKRSLILLAADAGESNSTIATKYDVTENEIVQLKKQYRDDGLFIKVYRTKEQIEDYKQKFYRDVGEKIFFSIIFSILINCFLNEIKFEFLRNFEVVTAMIGLLGIFAGFLVTSYTIIVLNIAARFEKEKEKGNVKTETEVDNYWEYILGTFKTILFLYVEVIGIFSFLLGFLESKNSFPDFSYLNNFPIPFVIFTTIYLMYKTVGVVFDYLSNPFSPNN